MLKCHFHLWSKCLPREREVSTLSCKCSNSLGLVGRETALPTGKENDLLKLVLQLEKVKFSISWPAMTVPKRLLPGARTNCKATGAVNMVNTLRIQRTTKIRIYNDLVSPRQQSLLTEWLKWQQKIAVAIVHRCQVVRTRWCNRALSGWLICCDSAPRSDLDTERNMLYTEEYIDMRWGLRP